MYRNVQALDTPPAEWRSFRPVRPPLTPDQEGSTSHSEGPVGDYRAGAMIRPDCRAWASWAPALAMAALVAALVVLLALRQ